MKKTCIFGGIVTRLTVGALKTGGMFDNGFAELSLMPKLLFNNAMCPVLMHTRPVPALHTFFYYTIGWMTYHQGEFTPKENVNAYGKGRSDDVKEYDALYGHLCEPPPDATFCFVMGLGFLILEILVPLIVIFIILKPMKPAIFASIKIGYEVAKDGTVVTAQAAEKFVTVPSWAGVKYAWIAIMVIGTFFGAGLLHLLIGARGFFIGGLAGDCISAVYILVTLGGLKSKIIVGPKPSFVIGLGFLLAGLVSVSAFLMGAFTDFADNKAMIVT